MIDISISLLITTMYPNKSKDECFADERTFSKSEGMSGAKVSAKSDTKLKESGHSFYESSRTDSGFLSGGNLVSDQNLSLEELSSPVSHKSVCDFGEVKSQACDSLMRLDSGVDVSLHDQFSGLSLHKNTNFNNLNCEVRDKGFSSEIIQTNEVIANIKPKPSECPQLPVTQPWELYFQQDEDGDTQLHIAIIQGFIEVVFSLIRMAPHPCFLDILNDVVQSPLHLAVLTHQPRIVRQLIVSGANVERRDRHGNTPLHLACHMGDVECVKALTEPIAVSEMMSANLRYPGCSSQVPQDFEEQNYDGEMCLHLAAYGGHIDVLRHLLWFGADVNAREGKSGRTILHYAVETSKENLLQFLLEECPIGPNGLELDTPTYSGHSAYQLAALMDRTVARELVARGATVLDVDDEDHPDHNAEDVDDLDDEIPELGTVYANLGNFRMNGEVLRV